MTNVLVTGGGGFIGSWVCKDLTKKGFQPIVFDHRTYVEVDKDNVARLILGDVRDYTSVLEAVAISDGVIHLAGVLGTQETIEEPLPAIETNIHGSLNVFKACRHYGKRCVYIAVGNHWMNNSYSISKTTAERFAFMLNREFGTRIAVVRGLNAYGPGQKVKPVRKIMPNFIVPALRGEDLVIYGPGDQVMDMVYVDDLADALVRALVLDHGVYDRAFEVGTGTSTTVLQIATEVVKQVGSGRIRHVPMRPGKPPSSIVVADTSLLYKLSVDPKRFVRLADGVSRTIPWYREQLKEG